jgi:hypothetical protein
MVSDVVDEFVLKLSETAALVLDFMGQYLSGVIVIKIEVDEV